jgi:hypothetical protein
MFCSLGLSFPKVNAELCRILHPTLGVVGLASPPMSMVQMEKIFSASVLAHTLPKPTLVRLLSVK